MLTKIFGKKKPQNNSLGLVHATTWSNPSGPGENGSRALKIIHAGGHAERHYMAIPAARIIEKYPSSVLARPEIFKRPWDSIVRPEDILVPGQKYYVVPQQTVKKLRRRIGKTGFSSSFGNGPHKDARSIGGILVKPGPKVKARSPRHVRFFDLEKKKKSGLESGLDSDLVSSDEKSGSKGEKGSKERSRNPKMDEKKRRAQNEIFSWEPSLDAINE